MEDLDFILGLARVLAQGLAMQMPDGKGSVRVATWDEKVSALSVCLGILEPEGEEEV